MPVFNISRLGCGVFPQDKVLG
uniref:Uncharacterized protein n=1 Tax=Anguilla anguilla TaxID=7936 RepID=A0A0E9T0V8_ANGAN